MAPNMASSITSISSGNEQSPSHNGVVRSQADTLIKQFSQGPKIRIPVSERKTLSHQKKARISITWFDLMIVLFILFFSLFIYQAIQNRLLLKEVTKAVETQTEPAPQPVKDTVPLIAQPQQTLAVQEIETVEEILPMPVFDFEKEDEFFEIRADKTFYELAENLVVQKRSFQRSKPIAVKKEENVTLKSETAGLNSIIVEPLPLDSTQNTPEKIELLYAKSMEIIDRDELDHIISIQHYPKEELRIILQGDLLFKSGQASLSGDAMSVLKKISHALFDVGELIHIEGHTDSNPITGGEFNNNFELSLARANAVATYLIDDLNMEPSIFVVSGFSSHRPISPNTNPQFRASNRRVEIVVKKSEYTQKLITSSFPQAYPPKKNS